MHGGGILASAADGKRIVTGGDDGKVVATDATGESRAVATDAKQRWIDQVALGPGRRGRVVGRQAGVSCTPAKASDAHSKCRRRSAGSPSRRKAFGSPSRTTTACRFGFRTPQAAPEFFEWKGSHLASTFSPDGRFLVTAMQEPTLHGWRVADAKHMRMSGYSARVRSFGWTADGEWLATSGSEQLMLWPFQGKDGPMGKQPKMLAHSQCALRAVACHPKQAVVAAGYADGTVLLVRIDDGADRSARGRRRAGHRARLVGDGRCSDLDSKAARRGCWCCDTIAVVPGERSESRYPYSAAAERLRSMGPRFRGDDSN